MTKNHENDAQGNVSTRLDKWLWAARFYKTRAIAKQMIDGGKVFYNGQRSKSGKAVVSVSYTHLTLPTTPYV